MSATSLEMSDSMLVAETQNCLQMIVSQLIASAKLIARMIGNQSPARQWMMCHIFHILNFPVGLCGPLGDSLRAGFGPWAGVCGPLL